MNRGFLTNLQQHQQTIRTDKLYQNRFNEITYKTIRTKILLSVPGFKTLEHFTVPSYHCLSIVRIVHSTLQLNDEQIANNNDNRLMQARTTVSTITTPTTECSTMRQTYSKSDVSSTSEQQNSILPAAGMISRKKNDTTIFKKNHRINNNAPISDFTIITSDNKKIIPKNFNSTISSNSKLLKTKTLNQIFNIGKNYIIIGTAGCNNNNMTPLNTKLLTPTTLINNNNVILMKLINSEIIKQQSSSSKCLIQTCKIISPSTILPIQFIYKNDNSDFIQLTPITTTAMNVLPKTITSSSIVRNLTDFKCYTLRKPITTTAITKTPIKASKSIMLTSQNFLNIKYPELTLSNKNQDKCIQSTSRKTIKSQLVENEDEKQ